MSVDPQALWDLSLMLFEAAEEATKPEGVTGEAVGGGLTPKDPAHIETFYRSATSRVYYSVFHQARLKVCRPDGPTFDGGDCHRALQEHLEGLSKDGAKKIARNLRTLHEWRCQADYREITEHVSNHAKKARAKARDINRNIVAVFGA